MISRRPRRREALEEGGLRLGALEHVATVWSMPGVSTERMALYLAEYRARIASATAAASRMKTKKCASSK